MTITAGLAQFLIDSGLVGSRVYPLKIPQEQVLPAIAYQRIDTPRVKSHSGPSGLAAPRFQLTIQCTTYESMSAVARGVRERLNGFTGMMGTTEVQSTFVVNENEFDTEANKYFISRLDVVIWHRE